MMRSWPIPSHARPKRADRLKRMAPVPMSKVLFANSGSEANDDAIKMTRCNRVPIPTCLAVRAPRHERQTCCPPLMWISAPFT